MQIFFIMFCCHTASAPITSVTHTGGYAVIRQPGIAWLEVTPAIEVGRINVGLKWMYLYVEIRLRN